MFSLATPGYPSAPFGFEHNAIASHFDATHTPWQDEAHAAGKPEGGNRQRLSGNVEASPNFS